MFNVIIFFKNWFGVVGLKIIYWCDNKYKNMLVNIEWDDKVKICVKFIFIVIKLLIYMLYEV